MTRVMVDSILSILMIAGFAALWVVGVVINSLPFIAAGAILYWIFA